MDSGTISVIIPIPLALAIPAGFVVVFALIRGLLDILPL